MRISSDRRRGSSWLPVLALGLGFLGCATESSELWGRRGELWDPAGRLPDFSYAGYHSGEDPIPDVPVKANVRDFGAVGDGVTDDTQAVLDAIASVDAGAVFFPVGRYVITRPLFLRRSHVVLRGESRDKSVLYFPKTLHEVLGHGKDGGPRGWSWGGAWIWMHANLDTGDSNGPVWNDGELLSRVAQDAAKGETSLLVEDGSSLTPGRLVRLVQNESEGSLTMALHAGHRLKRRCKVSRPRKQLINWVVRVTRVEGDRVHFDRPLRIDAKREWRARLMEALPPVEEVGVEHLTIEFEARQYLGHHNEPGMNAISFGSAYNSWVRDVAIVNADNGIFFWYARYASVEDVVIGGRGGHYAFNLGGAQDSLLTRFRIENASFHDTSNSNMGNGNVISWGQGQAINFDHHRGAPFQNLYSQIHVGRVSRMWRSSATPSGHYTAAHETFWQIRPVVVTESFRTFPAMNIVGKVVESQKSTAAWFDLWIEPIEEVDPPDLHSAQLARRLGTPLPSRPDLPPGLPAGVGSTDRGPRLRLPPPLSGQS